VILYAESSAVLTWLLAEPGAAPVAATLQSAQHVIVSDLLFIECDRACIRAETVGVLTAEQAAATRALLARTGAHWETLRISPAVIARSRQPFPAEPVRSLDAIHLASALDIRSALPSLQIVSLDQRVRDNALQLGFEVLPDRNAG
jgi:hypothetical protein